MLLGHLEVMSVFPFGATVNTVPASTDQLIGGEEGR